MFRNLFLLIILPALPSFAQSGTSSISGTVKDDSGAPIPGAHVKIVNQETGVKGREPLLTLSRYRREGDKIKFGQNVLSIDHNEIHEGDEIILG